MKPEIGDIVHYVSHGTPVRGDGTQEYASECRAAIVTAIAIDGDVPEVPDSWVLSVAVLNPEGLFFSRYTVHDDRLTPEGGTWHYSKWHVV